MPKRYNEKPINEMRRRDRSKNEEWIIEFLNKAPFASIATLHGDRPFINTNIFVLDEDNNCIYFHTSREGRLRYNITDNAKVCLSTAEMGRLLPADTALEFSVEYKSAVVFGSVEVIEEENAAKAALQKLMYKYFPEHIPGKDYREIVPEEIKRTAVYKINIESMSGKEKKVDDDFPGAFLYKQKKS